ncbi:MAG: hypothetical protein WA118_06275 [Carboxydocellales bacterium]
MKSKSTFKNIIVGILASLVIIGSVVSIQSVQANVVNVIPDKEVIRNRVHLKQIETYKGIPDKDQQNKAINRYLSQLDIKELLETAAEINLNGRLEQEGQIIVPHIKKAWHNGVPYKDTSAVVKDKDHNPKFRIFVLDGITNSANQQGYESSDVIDTILSIAQDNSDNEDVRRYALLKLRKPGAFTKNESIGGAAEKSELFSLFNEQASPAKVKGAAITAMRRTKDPNFKAALNAVLTNPEKYPSIVIQHAALDAAKGGLGKIFITQLRNLAETTKDADLFGSTVYALGLTTGSEAVNTIVSTYGKFGNESIARFSLIRNQKIILSMLDINQSDELVSAGIKAAEKIKLQSSIVLLENIAVNSRNQELRNAAKIAAEEIKTSPEQLPDNFYKWEDK